MTQRLTRAFPVGEDALWRALRAALPCVTTHATFWEQAQRVQWSSDATPFSWGLVFELSVEGGADGSSALTLSSRGRVRTSRGDRDRRAAIFETLVGAVSKTLSQAAEAADEVPTEDRVRYWDGQEWTIEPPSAPG